MAQIINITSEALQATIRRLLPSQQGFGEDLQATNVVTPIIDLTPTAEGSVLPQYLQQSINFDGATAISSNNSTDVIANAPGFYRVLGGVFLRPANGSVHSVAFTMTDGLSTKTVYKWETLSAGTQSDMISVFDQVFFLAAGESVSVTTTTNGKFIGSSRQVATVTGDLVNPSGFTFE